MTQIVIERLRELCMGFPEATEEPFGGHTRPTWRVNKKIFAMLEEEREAVWFKAPPGAQAILVDADSERFFVPPYVGHRGWVGVRTDVDGLDWEELRGLIAESYRMTAPKRLLRK